MTHIHNMGIDASSFFHGSPSQAEIIKKLFTESADFISGVIKENIKYKTGPYLILDIGSHKGELIENIVSKLPELDFEIFATDINPKALKENKISKKQIVCPATQIPLNDNSVEISIVRYVLHWNSLEDQIKILREAYRVSSDFIIVQHVGADNEDTVDWQNKMHTLTSGKVAKLDRPGAYFSSLNEIIKILEDNSMKYKIIQDRKILNASLGFQERFNLTNEEYTEVKNILDDKDYVIQSSIIIYKG